MIRDRIIDLRRVPAGTLRPHPRNWRKHPTRQRQALATALERIGYADALIARETPDGLELIDGHLRADLDADQTVPVLVVDLDDAEADAMLATFDPLAGMAERDTKILDELLARVAETDLDALARNVWPGRMGTPPGADDVPEPPSEPVCKPGDLWQLGRHRLLCGDATKRADLAHLVDGQRPSMLLTDPPYGVSHGRGLTKAKQIRADTTQAVIPLGFAVAVETLSADALVYCFGGSENFAMYLGLFDHYLGQQPHLIVWVKDGFVLRQHGYHSQFELVYWGWRGKGGAVWYGERNRSDVWQVSRPKRETEHSTEKPVALLSIPIESTSEVGSIILEPFAGSGTTIIAAETLDRTCYAIEIEPWYCDVIIERWQNFTGQQAQRIDTG